MTQRARRSRTASQDDVLYSFAWMRSLLVAVAFTVLLNSNLRWNMTGLPAPETDWVTTYLHKYRPSAHPMVNVQTPHGAGDQPQLASRNNNPGNLNYAHQPNAV